MLLSPLKWGFEVEKDWKFSSFFGDLGRRRAVVPVDNDVYVQSADMNHDLIILHSQLSRDACQNRISSAASQDPNEIIGYALTSQVDVIDGGDCFESRHKLAVLRRKSIRT